jgi:hypothetical protein
MIYVRKTEEQRASQLRIGLASRLSAQVWPIRLFSALLVIDLNVRRKMSVGRSGVEHSGQLPLAERAGKLTEGWTDFALKDGNMI